MVWNEEIEVFVKTHIREDVRQLALRKHHIQGEELRTALMQIELRQRIMEKLPHFSSVEGVRFPSKLSTEQCSSERCATFKREIVGGFYEKGVDLTGGLGIDTLSLAQLCEQMTYIEQDADICQAARNNIPLMADNIEIRQMTAEEWLMSSDERIGLAFIDPARRDETGEKVFKTEDCIPNIKMLLPRLKARAEKVVIKLSPMLDLKECIETLKPEKLWIISVNNECKELVAVVGKDTDETDIEAIELRKNGNARTSFKLSEEKNANGRYARKVEVGQVIAEPYAAQMKSGAWKTLCQRYNAEMIAPSSHLYVTEGDFPGRQFTVAKICIFNKRNAAKILKGKANIAVRNFPMTVAQIRKRFGTAEGGERYIFLTTDTNNNRIIIECKKLPLKNSQ